MASSSSSFSKSENKLKSFLRSRSRSRSRPSDSTPPTPTRHLHLKDVSTASLADNPPSSYLKSSVRSQNRPISSTTTATHSTITPLPSDVLRNRYNAGRHAYAFHPHSTDTHTYSQDHDHSIDTCVHDSDDNHFPRSETPSSTRRRRLAWHYFFGISLTRRSSSSTSTPHHSTPSPERKVSTSTFISDSKYISPRRRSFRLTSRPTTPKSVDASFSIPTPSSPLPLSASPRRRSFGLGSSQRSTPISSTGHLPLPQVQNSQSSRSHGRRLSVGSERTPHDSAVALPEESHRTVHKSLAIPNGGTRNKGKERQNPLADEERLLPDVHPYFDSLSQSLPEPSSLHYLSPHTTRHPPLSHLPTVDSISSEENEQSSHRLHTIPQIIHTPPTPQRLGGELESLSKTNVSSPTFDSGKIEISKRKAMAMPHREQVLISSSQSHSDVRHPASSKARFTPRFLSGKDTSKPMDSIGQRSGRRPIDGCTHKTPVANSIGPVRNMTSHRGKLGSFDFERPVSALNRSSSTVDRQRMHVQADNSPSSNAHPHSLERTISQDSARGVKTQLIPRLGHAETLMLSQSKLDHMGSASVISFSSVSLQTKSTGKDVGSNTPTGQPSSWGRASGKRIQRTSHGTFAFEHPSSVPSTPNPHIFNLPNGANWNDTSEQMPGLPQSQPTGASHIASDARLKHSRGQSLNTTDYVEPSCPSPGERKSKGKGRSLDLGLGLSWAPSRLREEILMPGSLLAREKVKSEKSKANGSDVTKMFESLLSESGFQTFKKCVRRFDAHLIPLEGPSGLLARVENLLAESDLTEEEISKLVTEFTVFVETHGG